MNRAIYTGTLFVIILLLIGSYKYSSDPLMLFASSTRYIITARIIMGLMTLFFLLKGLTGSVYLRILVGCAGICLVGVAVNAAFSDHLKLFDAILFLDVGIVFNIAALDMKKSPSTLGIYPQEQYILPQSLAANVKVVATMFQSSATTSKKPIRSTLSHA